MTRFLTVLLTVAAATTGMAACASTAPVLTPPAASAAPAAASLTPQEPQAPLMGLSPALPARIDSIINAAITDHSAPAMAVAIGRYDRLIYLHSYGRLTYDDTAPAVDEHTRFDLASLTKVIATTTAAMMLEEQGRLDINRTVRSYLPEFNAPDKKDITVRMLITHRGGLEAFAPLWHTLKGRQQYLEAINSRPLAYVPGSKSVYSDWDYVLMGLIVERITGQTLDTYTAQHIFGPLGMMDTGFRPDTVGRSHIAPTEINSARGLVWGTVHDENADAIGGVAGHAGLFSTAHDLAIFARMMLNGGSVGSVRLLAPTTIARWTAPQDAGSSRALGWDTPAPHSSAGRFFSPRSYGHTGFTGTSIWTDPQRGVWVILLTNRVYPTRNNNKHLKLRRDISDAVQEAVTDAPLIDWESQHQQSAAHP